MSAEHYQVPDLKPGERHRAEETIRRSRFIVTMARVASNEEAKAFIDEVRAEHAHATHNCWAYVAGAPGDTARIGASDDGEPKGTAGRPMLTALLHSGVGEIAAVVTRYFGGILLGAGGLTRAYTKTAKMALDAAGIARRCVWDCVDISCSYAFLERARLELAAQSGEELNAEYGAAVLLHACLPQEKTAALAARLRELSAGTVTPVKTGNIYRAERVEK